MWRTIDRTLRSHGMAAALILCIAVASVFGTLPSEGANRVYWSWWYIGLLTLLASLMAYATVRRLPVVWRVLVTAPPARSLSGGDARTAEPVSVPESAVGTRREQLIALLRRRGFRPIARPTDDATNVLLFDKGRAGLLGPPLLHMGLVIALVGGVITHRYGSVRDFELGEGETVTIPEIDARVRLAKFSIITEHATRQPEAYVSTLLVQRGPGEPELHQLEVNRPLSVYGTTFFQMRYRPEVRHVRLGIYTAASREMRGTLQLESGTKTRVPNHDVAVELGDVVPDFAVDNDNRILTRSPYFVNPAARIAVYAPADAPEPLWRGWVYQAVFPEHDAPPLPLTFVLDQVSVKYYSGIKLSRDPGVLIAYVGFLLLLIGVFLSAYLYPRVVRVEFAPEEGSSASVVHLSGSSAKHRPDFAYEWKGLVTELHETLLK